MHPHRHDVLADLLEIINGSDLARRIHLRAEALSVRAAGDAESRRWLVSGSANNESAFAIKSELVCLCTNDQLGSPYNETLREEGCFAGSLCFGLADDVKSLDFAGMNVIILGMDTLAIDLMRTALGRNQCGSSVVFLSKQLSKVTPRLLDWLHYIRPWDVDLHNHRTDGNMKIWDAIRGLHASCGATLPKATAADAYSGLLSDLFFIGSYLRVVAACHGEVDYVEPTGIMTLGVQFLRADILIKCGSVRRAGPTTAATLDTNYAFGVGLVDLNLWHKGTSHADHVHVGDTSSPWAPNHCYGWLFSCKLVLHCWRNPEVMTRMKLSSTPRVSLNQMSPNSWLHSFRQLATCDAQVLSLLKEHVELVQHTILSMCTAEDYIAANKLEWDLSFQLLLARTPIRTAPIPFAYPFEEITLQILRDEAPQTLLLEQTRTISSSSVEAAASWDDSSLSSVMQQLARMSAIQRQAYVSDQVLSTARALLASQDASFTMDVPLMDAGIDSLAVTELASQLRSVFDIELSPTLLFEQPTARAIALHVSETTSKLLVPSPATPSPTVQNASVSRASHDEIVGLHQVQSRWAGEICSDAAVAALLSAAGSSIVQVPGQRWFVESQSKVTQYGGFLAAVERFDAPMFALSPVETAAMDPQQRLLLEVGYASLHCSGHTRRSMAHSDVGVFVGIEHLDWQLLCALRTSQTVMQRESAYAASGEQPHVASGRISFTFGLHGPAVSINTACSSALAAVHCTSNALPEITCGHALAASAKVILLPFGVGGGIVALDGLSKTFDARADGYGRSEAVAAVTLDAVAAAPASLQSSGVQASGRGASLTAPNGSAQRTLLQLVMHRAGLSADDVRSIQPQGLGSALADPIEIRAVMDVLGAGGTSHLAVGCHKANVGHSEAPSGLLGVLVAHSVVCKMSAAANAQLRKLNPTIQQSLLQRATMPMAAPANSMMALCVAASGVMTFGMSGTLAHAVIRHVSRDGTGAKLPALLCTRHPFPWQSAARHPMVQQHLTGSHEVDVFRSPVAGVLHALVANHVVHGRIVFPGAGYLEMARASTPQDVGAHGVFFLQPLLVEVPDLLVDSVVAEGRFDVQSEGEDAITHCSGAIGVRFNSQQCVQLAMTRTSVLGADVSCMYDMFFEVGLQYGPGYRTLAQAWGGTTVASARLRSRSKNGLTQVHPADLDDALCVSVLLPSSSGGGETRLPFAVDDGRLQGASGELWAVRCAYCK
jgi:3-oxoacyl-(acyl-carrier-protein) synthase/acyl carrier protein